MWFSTVKLKTVSVEVTHSID